MLDPIIQDLRYALRSLRSSPGFAAVAILSLALGIGANTAIFSLIDSVMLKTLPVSHPEELLQVTTAMYRGAFTNPIWEQIRDDQDVFSGVFAYSLNRYNLSTGGEARYVLGSRVSGQYFETLGVHTVLGRTLTAADDKRGCAGTAVLSYDFWQRAYGGKEDILGQPISLDGHPFEIVGVTQPGFSGVEVGNAVDVSVPICTDAIIMPENNSLDKRGDWWLNIIGRPKPGITPAQVTARLNTLAPEIFKATLMPNDNPDRSAKFLANKFQTAPAANGMSAVRSVYRLPLLTLMVVVGIVLLIACANVANLLLARGAARQREIAIRMALGSGRARIIRQLLTESLLLALGGAALGVMFAQWGTHLLVGFLSTSRNSISLDLSIDGRMLAFTAAVAILTALLFGLAPAWRGTRVQPQAAMKANSRGVISLDKPGSKFGLGKTLVMVQVALSLVLVVGAGLMVSTFWKLTSQDTGFDRQNVLLVNVDIRNANYPPDQRSAAYRQMLERVREIPGVQSASISGMTPISSRSWTETIGVDNITGSAAYNSVNSQYFETLGTPFILGRDFNQRDTPTSPPVAIVNEAFVKKYFGGANPLGKTYQHGADPLVEIVGVVKDSKYYSLREAVPPTFYRLESQEKPRGFAVLEIRADTNLIPAVKAAMQEVNRNLSLTFTTFATQVDESLTREKLLATLSGFFGALALLLAMIGLYGVMSYNVARRRNEIGIRMALGAEQARVLRMVLGEVALLIALGLIGGLAITLAATRYVSSFLYQMTPNDPRTLGSAAVVLAIVAVVAGYLPARRASRLDPMTALREE